ncbi:NAD(P)-dependent dehydrogenase, short-chain alcohol dehydrogenase family [Cnuella takakiae]|uniref:NAD(P)-dependent dehydrogenase, short-chain alcohol dehydrogenase family n=1 Tax=Cnuella takakiae TaxID=1302690 RepID=A0A1M5CLT4_9BACT|nr:SDR family NAD(P)-dependent oxidoreductase [Cnuella takakiae]OLY91872.1 daunorubicin C-13 ketoreductase [Cnuella takakiae]SHF55688.1 NAD(P)-dependent dehydrogenase, short-chain alcohol dehydrogenase family [Cnuella takakiae]
MARIFITGSADGLGALAAKALIEQGHEVVLHARNAERGRDAMARNPGAAAVVTGDLTDTAATIALASEVNKQGAFDVVIHNAGVYQVSAKEIFAVNTLAPYILTCLVQKPKRLIYLSSGMHMQGSAKLNLFATDVNRITYSDSKLHVLMLCKAVARKWPDVYANALDPGWVPTKMGGRGAPDDLQKGYETQVWLATSGDAAAQVSGRYFFHQKERPYNREADDVLLQDQLLQQCAALTGVSFPQ